MAKVWRVHRLAAPPGLRREVRRLLRDRFTRRVTPPAEHTWYVARARDGELLAAASVDRQGTLWNLCSRHEGRGAGSRLVRTVRHLIRDLYIDDPALIPFYARLGFEALEASQCGPELARALHEEAERGLDPSKRIAMRWRLDVGAPA